MGRSLVVVLLSAGCHQLFGLDKVPDAVPSDSLLPDTPPGQCGHRGVATGRRHTCVIDIDGAVWCWGANEAWQAMAGGADVVVDPVRVDALPMPAIQIAAGRSVSCARLVDGSVWCWGKNEYGELGLGLTSERGVPSPANLDGDKAIDVEVGAYHVCIRRESDGAAVCWGSNRLNESGDAPEDVVTSPTLVAGTAGMQRLSVGHRHNCGISATGTVQCWGRGDEGQLGMGVASSGSIKVANGIAGATALTASGRATCAIVGGAVRCWGSNSFGQLGNGGYGDVDAPGTVTVSDAVDVALGSSGGCSMRDDGLVQCWGQMLSGDGTFSTSALPRPSSVTSASAVVAGFYHVCAIVDGETRCWGENAFGELGRGTRSISAVPVTVTLPAPAAEVSVGEGHACARLTNNDVYCWGNNYYGELGNGTHNSTHAPAKVGLSLTAIVGIAAGNYRACAWNATSARCWGINASGVLGNGNTSHDNPSPVAVSATGLKSLALGSFHTCAITSADGVQCWGANSHGQLGNNTTTASTAPVNAPLTTTAAQLAAGGNHTCVRQTDSKVACWGENTSGQVGNNSAVDAKLPVVLTLTGVSDVSAARNSTCAISSGKLYCWGANEVGQLGVGDQTTRAAPVQVSLPALAVDVELGATGGCVRLTNDATYCWGAGERGQLANGQTTSIATAPIEVSALAGVSAIGLEGGGGCSRTAGVVQCWGTSALLGDGDPSAAEPHLTKLACP